MMSLVDRLVKANPLVKATLFVDDLSIEATGTAQRVAPAAIKAGVQACTEIEARGMEVSKSKCLCTASDERIGLDIQKGLKQFGVRYQAEVKSLGVGMAAGKKRPTKVQAARLNAFKKRIGRLRILAKSGKDPARILRTGGSTSMTYGQVHGVPDTTLYRQRSAVARAIAHAGGPAGQDHDLTMILAEGRHGHFDPAFAAHEEPVVSWARAIYNAWMPWRRREANAVVAERHGERSRAPQLLRWQRRTALGGRSRMRLP